MERRNLAARIGHWSTQHRRIAIGGWLGLVVVALALSSGVGLNIIKQENLGSGESRRADQAQAKAGFYDRATEQILIQSRNGETIASPRFKAAVSDAASTVRRSPNVFNVESPLRIGNEGQVSRDRRSALVVFDVRGDSDQTEDRVGPILDSVATVQGRHPGFRVEQFGDAS